MSVAENHMIHRRDEEDVAIQRRILELQEQSLVPLKEDLCGWLEKLVGMDIKPSSFLANLDSGILLCKLAKLIQSQAEECQRQGKLTEQLPAVKIRCNTQAQSGTWFARDNSANFLSWCRHYGLRNESLFEVEDLVAYKSEKQVIASLLELGRLAWKFGIEPPSLIRMEREIEREQSDFDSLALRVSQEKPCVVPVEKPRPATASKKITLDGEVQRVAAKCKCLDHVKRIKEGVYNIFGKVVFIRLLKERHLMVRVGGGWTTLESYLMHHNPDQVFEFCRTNPEDQLQGLNKFLVIKGKYKTPYD